MAENKKRSIYVVGHKNPDTDSICSAIAYANLKNKISSKEYKAKRAGQINEETQYVLKKFG
ncbi:MAG: DHH family phosphoesterase, partial [Eubacteriales bacterium]